MTVEDKLAVVASIGGTVFVVAVVVDDGGLMAVKKHRPVIAASGNQPRQYGPSVTNDDAKQRRQSKYMSRPLLVEAHKKIVVTGEKQPPKTP